jgi:hypothetical protein
MSKKLLIVTISFLLINFLYTIAYTQSGVDLYTAYYESLWLSLAPGDTFTGVTPFGNPNMSWHLNSNYAIHIKMLDNSYANYPQMFIYSEVDQPFVGGTDQYSNKLVKISCVPTGQLPQPDIYIPIDLDNINPQADGNWLDWPWIPDNNLLVIRKAFFWENSEDVGGLHGPFGDIKISVCTSSIANWTYHDFLNNWQSIKDNSNYRFRFITLPGPIYACDSPIGFAPEPKNEWIDGPWGCYYSNIALIDWDNNNSPSEVTIVITEADVSNDEDILGWQLVSSNDEQILIKARMFGWVELQKVTADFSGKEPSVDLGDFYCWDDWDGSYPEGVDLGSDPETGLIIDALGTQYKPYSNYLQMKLITDLFPVHLDIGLYPGIYPAVTINNSRTYYSVGGGTAIFGAQVK